jgi:IS30 family transposase
VLGNVVQRFGFSLPAQSRVGGHRRGQIVDAICIRESPVEIEDRAIPGHLEGDLIGGTNENTNGLLRQYFPKGTDLSGYSQAEFNKVALRLNQRPRKTLGFETPEDRLQASVALTH